MVKDNILPISNHEIRQWQRLSTAKRIEGNLQRLDLHLISYKEVLDKPIKPWIQSQYNLIFMHVPKTGGTTIEYLLAKNYVINQVLHINGPVLLKNPYALFKGGALPHVIMGHYETDHLLYRFIDKPLVHITMLRDPVRRVLSYFDYLQTDSGHPLHEKTKSLSLDQFIDSKDIVELENAQTLRIAGRLRKRFLFRGNIAEAFNIAKESLEKRFTLVGLTERYPEFLLMARQTLGWKDIYHELRNVSKRKTRAEDVSEEILDKIKERNVYDINLYNFARELFEQRCQELNITESRVEKFKKYNRQYQKLVNVNEL